MSDKCAKLKLKRKKPTVPEYKSVQNVGCCERDSKRAKEGASLLKCTAQRPDGGAEEWWSSTGLGAVERLWVSALKSAIPELERGVWEPVSDFPAASVPRTSDRDDTGWTWRGLGEEVGPFPSAATDVHISKDSLCPTDSGPGSSENGTALTEHKQGCDLFPRPDGLALRLGNEQGQQRRPQESTSSWETTGGSASADRQRPQVEPAGASLVAAGSERIADQDSTVGADGSSRGGDSLESCPMCLMRFPAGFSQMDCDSHLAKCLSEMNEDITW